MAEAKRFKVVAAESAKAGTKHRVQLEIQERLPRRVTALVDGKPVVSYELVFKPVYIKNVLLDDVQAATIQGAAQALIVEFKAQMTELKPSAGFSPYEEEFDRS